MNIIGLLIFPVLLLLLVSSLVGLFWRPSNVWFGVAGALIIVPATLGAIHAWGESRSIPFTVGYGAIALIGLINVYRHLLSRIINSSPSLPE